MPLAPSCAGGIAVGGPDQIHTNRTKQLYDQHITIHKIISQKKHYELKNIFPFSNEFILPIVVLRSYLYIPPLKIITKITIHSQGGIQNDTKYPPYKIHYESKSFSPEIKYYSVFLICFETKFGHFYTFFMHILCILFMFYAL